MPRPDGRTGCKPDAAPAFRPLAPTHCGQSLVDLPPFWFSMPKEAISVMAEQIAAVDQRNPVTASRMARCSAAGAATASSGSRSRAPALASSSFQRTREVVSMLLA